MSGNESMTVRETYEGSDGKATTALYDRLTAFGTPGIIALNLFRAQKASERAKTYSRRYRGEAYQKKNWSLGLLVTALIEYAGMNRIVFGWKRDPNPPIGYPWVLYIDLPTGQVSFHAADRGVGPDYVGEWENVDTSANRIIGFVESVLGYPQGGLCPNTSDGIKSILTDYKMPKTAVDDDCYKDQLEAWKRKHGL